MWKRKSLKKRLSKDQQFVRNEKIGIRKIITGIDKREPIPGLLKELLDTFGLK